MSDTPPPTLPLVRGRVRDILTSSPSFRRLPEAERRDLAANMVKVAQYIVGGESGDNVPVAAELAGAAETGSKLPDTPQPRQAAGKDFDAAAARQGSDAYTDTVKKVDFPKFVAGLIDGVFNAIVTSSIKQMEAYAELVKNVAKSVDQFMKDNVSENQARDYLTDRYPDHLELDLDGEEPKVKPKSGYDEDNLPDFMSDLGMKVPLDSFDDDGVEQQLVPAARRRMAMDRQQLLATMVLMGINRLVVTNGSINASCVFKLDTTDRVKRGYQQKATQAGSAYHSESERKRPGFWGWFSGSTSSSKYDSEFGSFNVETHQDEDSEATAKMKAELKGNVSVNFKSETFPLERMADILQVNQIREKAPAGMSAPGGPGAPAPGTTPAAGAAPAAKPTK